MLISDMRLILSPVIVNVYGDETEYENGALAADAFKPGNRLEIKSLSVRGGKIVIEISAWETNALFNFIGEESII